MSGGLWVNEIREGRESTTTSRNRATKSQSIMAHFPAMDSALPSAANLGTIAGIDSEREPTGGNGIVGKGFHGELTRQGKWLEAKHFQMVSGIADSVSELALFALVNGEPNNPVCVTVGIDN